MLLFKRIIPFFCLLFLTSCGSSVIYQQFYTLYQDSLARNPGLRFQFIIPDTTQTYDVYLVLHYTPLYPYQNLYVTYTLRSSNDTVVSTKLCNYMLFDPKTGKPFGEGWGESKSSEHMLLENYSFKQADNYFLLLNQYMRQDPLPGIAQLGIKIRKKNPS